MAKRTPVVEEPQEPVISGEVVTTPDPTEEIEQDPSDDPADPPDELNQAPADPDADPADADPAPENDGELVVTIGDEAPPEDPEELQTPAIRQIRQAHRDAVKALRAKDAEIAKLKGQQTTAPIDETIVVGPEPDMGDEDVDFDPEKFKAKYKGWSERKGNAEKQQAERAAAQESAQKAWNATLTGYQAEKAALKAGDAEDAELAVTEALSVTQQGIILKGIKKRALMILALGRNPKKLKEVAAITDPVDFAIAVGKLEDQLKTTTKKAPAPEARVSGSKPGAAAVDSALARLEEEADRTGDRSKIVAYKRDKKAKARA